MHNTSFVKRETQDGKGVSVSALARYASRGRALQTHHAPRSEEHQVGIRSFCGSYDFFYQAAFDQQGVDRHAAAGHDFPYSPQRLSLLTELRCHRSQLVGSTIGGRLDDGQDGYLRRCWYVQRSEQSCGCQCVLGFAHCQKTLRPLARSRGAPLLRAHLIRTKHGAELSTPSRD